MKRKDNFTVYCTPLQRRLACGENLVALWKQPEPVYKLALALLTMDIRRLSEKSGWSSWLGCLCRDIILFVSIFNMSAWSAQEFTMPVALWSLWWIPGFPQNYPLWTWSHVCWMGQCPFVGIASEIMWISEGSCHDGGCSWDLRWPEVCHVSWTSGEHGVHVDICSTVGQGCSFQPYLPLLYLLVFKGKVFLSL